MNKYLSLIAFALLITACAAEPQGPVLTDPFIGGNIGLNLYLREGMPPPQIYDGGKFPFGVHVVIENVGETAIGPGTDNPFVIARLEGINPVNFGVTSADLDKVLTERVAGAKKNFDGTILPGQIGQFTWDNLNYQTELVGNQLVTLRGVVCYDYSNIATTQLCMKDDVVEYVQDTTLCSLNGAKPVHNSGGPMHITSVTQNPINEERIQVTLVLEHVGGEEGTFYGRTPEEECNSNVRNTNKFHVHVEIEADDPGMVVACSRLQNSNVGDLTLYNGAPQTLSCTVERAPGNDVRIFEPTLTVRSSYRYGQWIEQPVLVQAVPE